MLFIGGACSQGPGMVVNDELKVEQIIDFLLTDSLISSYLITLFQDQLIDGFDEIIIQPFLSSIILFFISIPETLRMSKNIPKKSLTCE